MGLSNYETVRFAIIGFAVSAMTTAAIEALMV
jgi:hypothetical protein